MDALWILASTAQAVIVLGTCYAIVKLAGKIFKDAAFTVRRGAAEDRWRGEVFSDDSPDDYLSYDSRADKTEPGDLV